MTDHQPEIARIEEGRALLDRQERILCDLDGCLIQDGAAIEGAAELVARHGRKFRILTNNSTDTPDTLSDKLAGYGIGIDARQIVLAGSAAVDILADRYPGARILMLASDAIRDHARKKGLIPLGMAATDLPDLVLICRDTGFTYDRIQQVINHVGLDVPYYAANPDLTHPGRGGLPVIETGLILQMIRQACGRPPRAVIGKPEPDLYLAALDGVAPQNAVMIGDNPRTDIEGAARLDMPSIQVGPTFTVGKLL